MKRYGNRYRRSRRVRRLVWFFFAAMLTVTGCGAASGATHTAEQGSAVDQVLAERAAESRQDPAEGASRSDLILTPDSYREDSIQQGESSDAAVIEESADWRTVDPASFEPEMVTMPDGCDVDVDLTVLNSSLVYAEVYNMMYYPEKFVGKKIRMRGMYSIYVDEETEKTYYACFISDAAACCQQGVEFDPGEELRSWDPKDFPKQGDEITVVGVYDTYEEDGYKYCTLRDAVLEEIVS